MPYFELALMALLLALTFRTIGWHLQCWQLREYRLDRMRAWLSTKDGKAYFTPWKSRGLLPRPKLSGRILLMLFIAFGLLVITFLLLGLIPLAASIECAIMQKHLPPAQSPCLDRWFNQTWPWLLILLICERLVWAFVALAVGISAIPVKLKKRWLFHQAGKIVRQGGDDIIRIGITGSYGKSSTKELLVHLLKAEFGEANVLFNPANENTEVAIARLILQHKDFFRNTPSAMPVSPPKLEGENNRKFLVIETGAYKKGEIATVTKMIKPQYSILTGLNQQHVELFGCIENTRKAKFELAEGTQNTVFFNGDNAYLAEIFADQALKAAKVPISFNAAKALQAYPDRTEFKAYGQDFTLPWPGEFFVHNALLAMECARELGLKPASLAEALATLPPLKRALSSRQHPQGFTVLRDTYSANPDGVLGAIEHLKHFSGARLFISIPLRELGGDAPSVHAQIFKKLKSIDAETYWQKKDFADLGATILGEKFHPLKPDKLDLLKARISKLGTNDVVLLESKLDARILTLFNE